MYVFELVNVKSVKDMGTLRPQNKAPGHLKTEMTLQESPWDPHQQCFWTGQTATLYFHQIAKLFNNIHCTCLFSYVTWMQRHFKCFSNAIICIQIESESNLKHTSHSYESFLRVIHQSKNSKCYTWKIITVLLQWISTM